MAPNMSKFNLLDIKELIEKHNTLKREVLQALQDLADEAEGLVFEKIEIERQTTIGKLVGRGIIIGSGILSLCLLPIPIASSVVGAAGIVIGYAVLAGSKWYEMKAPKKHSERFSRIYEKLQRQLDRYTESQKTIFGVLNNYHIFEPGKDFKTNLDIIGDLVKTAEKEEKCVGVFDLVEDLLSKLRRTYNKLDEDQRGRLNSNDFLITTAKLLDCAGTSDHLSTRVADIGSAAASAIGDIVSVAPWFEVIHGLNILINTGFIIGDIKKFRELQKMRKDWYEGGDARLELLKNPKFEKEIKFRDNIREIRDNIMMNGY